MSTCIKSCKLIQASTCLFPASVCVLVRDTGETGGGNSQEPIITAGNRRSLYGGRAAFPGYSSQPTSIYGRIFQN